MILYVSYAGVPVPEVDRELVALIGVESHTSGYSAKNGRRELLFRVPQKRAQALLKSMNGTRVLRRPITVTDKIPQLGW